MEMEWISVNDELPRNGLLVMAATLDTTNTPHKGAKHLENYATYDAKRKEWYRIEGEGIMVPFRGGDVVTHWMRYPELPD